MTRTRLHTPDLSTSPRLLRGPVATGLADDAVQWDGGKHGAGMIRGLAVVTRGEALGHDLWIDEQFLAETAAAINSAGERGIKARFTHPGLSSDGLGSFLGRVSNATVDSDVVRGDLHFARSAHDTPDGDLAEYVMLLASEDPSAFGTSIVFEHDLEAEAEFELRNEQEVEETDRYGNTRRRVKFVSPDPRNSKHLRHARLARLRAVDTVDTPAANPDGLFGERSRVAQEAEQLAEYALGLRDEMPELSNFHDISPDRLQSFVARFLARHDLQLTRKEPDPVTDTIDPRAEFAAQLKQYVTEFGDEHGTRWAADNKPLEECRRLHAESVAARHRSELESRDQQIAALQGQVEELQTRIAQAQLGEAPVQFSASDAEPKTTKRLADRIRFAGSRN